MNGDTIFHGLDTLMSLKIGSGDTSRLCGPDNHIINYVTKGYIFGSLNFPSYLDADYSLYLWKKIKMGQNSKFVSVISFSNIPHEDGTSLWAIILLIGFIITIASFSFNPSKIIRNKIINEGRDLRDEMEYDLRKFLNGRKYTELTAGDKRQYNGIIRYYKEIENNILK